MLQTYRRFSIQAVKEEAQALVSKGLLGKHSQLYVLSRHFASDEWKEIEQQLTLNEYLLRDTVYDLLGQESWIND